MSDIAISIENVSKIYRLGQVGTGTISHDLNRWWYKVRGKDDPYLQLGQENARDSKGGQYVWALKDISFDIKQGEVLGIIGKNGAGKSTLLKLLSRVTAPTTGTIKAKGRVASLLEVGTGFHPELTGRENIYLNGAILGMTSREVKAKFDEIVDFSGVAKYVDTPVKRYSSGMYVRLAFAVAAYLEPEILIVDEVLAVGDIEFQKKCIGKIKDVSANQGRTVLFVSHNMASIEFLTDKAVVLKNGSIDYVGSPRSAIAHYFDNMSNVVNSNLQDRMDAKSDGNIVFSKAWIEDSNGRVVNEVRSGDNISLCVKYDIRDNTNYFDTVQIAFGLYKQNDVKVADLWNESVGKKLDIRNRKNGIIKCSISKLPLNIGSYYFNIHCKSYNVVRFSVERACNLNVIAGDFFNSGVILTDSGGVVLLEQDWCAL